MIDASLPFTLAGTVGTMAALPLGKGFDFFFFSVSALLETDLLCHLDKAVEGTSGGF